jgi:hypothetical protein
MRAGAEASKRLQKERKTAAADAAKVAVQGFAGGMPFIRKQTQPHYTALLSARAILGVCMLPSDCDCSQTKGALT